MSPFETMHVQVQLPGRTLFDGEAVAVGARDLGGAFGLLPNHVDLVTALVPAVLTLRQADDRERVFGLDEGLLVKRGPDVRIVARRGLESDDLDTLHRTVAEVFAEPDDEERVARTALSRLEAGMVRHFIELRERGA